MSAAIIVSSLGEFGHSNSSFKSCKKKSFKNLTPIKFYKHVVANVCKPEFLENHAEFSENSRVKFLSFKSSKGHFLGN